MLGSIHACNLLGVNYSLNNGLYSTKWGHSHLLFGQIFAWTEKFNNGLCTDFSWFCGLNSFRLINRKCEWTIRHLLSVPIIDLVDVAEDHLVLALHALGERGLLQRREVPVDYQPEVPHVILLRLDQLRDDEPATRWDGCYNRRRDGAVQPVEERGDTTGGGTGRYNRWRNGAIQPAEGRGGTTGGGTGRYNRWRNGPIQPANYGPFQPANYGALQGAL